MKNHGYLGRKIQLDGGGGGAKGKLHEICFLTVYFVVKVTSLLLAKFVETYTSFLYRKPGSHHSTKVS